MSTSYTLCGGTSRPSTLSGGNQLPSLLTKTVSPSDCYVSDIMTCQVTGGPSAWSVPFAVGWLETSSALSPAAWQRMRLAVVISAQGNLPPWKPLHSIPTIRWCSILSNSSWRGTLLIHNIVAHAVRVGLILSNCSRPNFLPSQSFILSHAAQVALPTLPVPRVTHGIAPLHVLLSLARKRSRLYAQIETIIGVVSAISRYFLSRLLIAWTRWGRCSLVFQIETASISQNSKLSPCKNSKVRAESVVDASTQISKLCVFTDYINSVLRFGWGI